MTFTRTGAHNKIHIKTWCKWTHNRDKNILISVWKKKKKKRLNTFKDSNIWSWSRLPSELESTLICSVGAFLKQRRIITAAKLPQWTQASGLKLLGSQGNLGSCATAKLSILHYLQCSKTSAAELLHQREKVYDVKPNPQSQNLL